MYVFLYFVHSVFFLTSFKGATNDQQTAAAPQPTALSEQQSLAPPNQQPASSSPLPQQLQQFNVASSSGSSPLPPPTQQPNYPPGVKVPQTLDQLPPVSSMLVPPQRLASTSPSAQQQSFGMQGQQPRGSSSNAAAAFPGSLSDLVVSFENVKQKGMLSYIYICSHS